MTAVTLLTGRDYNLSQKNGSLWITWHNFTNSQRLLIIFGRARPYSILNWCGKKFLNLLRTSCLVAIATVVTWLTRTANFWADCEQRVIDRALKKWQNNCGPVSWPKDCSSNTCCNFWHCTLFWQKHCLCLRDLSFLFIRQHQLWNGAYLRIVMVTASAGTLL